MIRNDTQMGATKNANNRSHNSEMARSAGATCQYIVTMDSRGVERKSDSNTVISESKGTLGLEKLKVLPSSLHSGCIEGRLRASRKDFAVWCNVKVADVASHQCEGKFVLMQGNKIEHLNPKP
mmetsp:Transcript_6557/g.9554  ORF Transcript_6557/g.9554 Transcript_6557/m.9554 type:complete len:123 (+) Transcript_6557:1931-2299(+)